MARRQAVMTVITFRLRLLPLLLEHAMMFGPVVVRWWLGSGTVVVGGCPVVARWWLPGGRAVVGGFVRRWAGGGRVAGPLCTAVVFRDVPQGSRPRKRGTPVVVSQGCASRCDPGVARGGGVLQVIPPTPTRHRWSNRNDGPIQRRWIFVARSRSTLPTATRAAPPQGFAPPPPPPPLGPPPGGARPPPTAL